MFDHPPQGQDNKFFDYAEIRVHFGEGTLRFRLKFSFKGEA